MNDSCHPWDTAVPRHDLGGGHTPEQNVRVVLEIKRVTSKDETSTT